MDKAQYRELFLSTLPYIKYSVICKEVGLYYANFSQFINGKTEYGLSVEKLELIRQRVIEVLGEKFGLHE